MSDIYLHLSGKKLLISFDYNQHTMERVKKISGTRWNKNLSRWEAPLAVYNTLVTELDNLKISKAVMEKMAAESEIRKKVAYLQKVKPEDHQITDYTPKQPFMAHQKTSLDLHRLLPGSASFSEMGSGKCRQGKDLQIIDGELVSAEETWDLYAKNNFTDGTGWWATPNKKLSVSSIDQKGKIIRQKVKKLYRQLVKETLREVLLDDGSSITITKAHKLLIKDRWTEDFRVGDKVCVPRYLPHETGDLDITIAELFGWMVGDGCDSDITSNAHTFTQKDDTDRAHVKKLFKNVAEQNSITLNICERKPTESHRASDLQVCNSEFRRLCESHGYFWGNLSATKKVPSAVMKANAEAVAAFLQGYFDAEAHVNTNRYQIEISSASHLMMKQVSTLLRRFGIWMRISKKRKMATNGLKIMRDYWEGHIGGPCARTFAKVIGCSTEHKKKALELICAVTPNSNVEGIPAHKILREIVDTTGLPQRHIVDSYTVYMRGTQEPCRKTLQTFINNIDKILDGTHRYYTRVTAKSAIDLMRSIYSDTQNYHATANDLNSAGILTKNGSQWYGATVKKALSDYKRPFQEIYDNLDKVWLKQKRDELQNLIDQEVHYAAIIKIEEIGYEGWVYDLEIDGEPNYVAENILCHNTCSAICAIHWNILTGKTKNCLVICPLSVIRGWEEQIEFFSNLSYIALVGKNKEEKLLKLQSERDVYLINYEGVWRDGVFEALLEKNINMVICDEAHRIKDPSSKQSKAAHQLGDAAEYRIALTGSPVLNSSMDAFGIMRFVDSEIFGDSFYSFRNKYFTNVAPEKSPFAKFIPRAGADKEISDKMYTRAIRYLKEECLDLPDAITMPDHVVTLSDEQDKAYREMQDNLCAQIEGNKEIKISHILTLMLKLNQITSGWIKDPETGKIHYFKTNPKFDALAGLVEEIGHKKAIIIWAYYIADMNLIYNYFSRCTNEKCKLPVNNIVEDICPNCDTPILYRASQIQGSTKNRRAEIAKFRFTREERAQQRKNFAEQGKNLKEIREEIGDPLEDGSEPPQTNIIACQCVAASEGLNLQRATEAIFYSRNYSLKDWIQALARNHRQGTTKTVTYMNLVAKLRSGDDTVDQKIVDALKRKEDLSRKMNKDDLKAIFGLKKAPDVEIKQDLKEGEEVNEAPPTDEQKGLF